MIRVDPMPDEPAVAHQGRLAWINGRRTVREIDDLLLQEIGKSNYRVERQPRLHHLALASGMTPSRYAHQHSLLPALIFASHEDCVYGGPASHALTRNFGLCTWRDGAYCCAQCIADDMSDKQFSWFRRSHQLKGVEWCQVHGCRLSMVESPEPFVRAPHYWLKQLKLRQIDSCIDKLPSSGFLRKYTDIVTAFLQQERSFRLEVINLQIANRVVALEARMRTPKDDRHRPVSVRIEKAAPLRWLDTNFENFLSPKHNYSSLVDVIASGINRGRMAHVYALVLSALYDSSEDAITAMYGPRKAPRESNPVPLLTAR